MLEHCKSCMDFGSKKDCALPSDARRLANFSLLVAGIVLDSTVRGCMQIMGRPAEEPDIFNHVDKLQKAIDESFVPSEACVTLRTQNNS